ncbi:hypothetical protein [Mesomycoplasma dispar]|nr:hypothetical protein [Mesomycoplasma dispar]
MQRAKQQRFFLPGRLSDRHLDLGNLTYRHQDRLMQIQFRSQNYHD